LHSLNVSDLDSCMHLSWTKRIIGGPRTYAGFGNMIPLPSVLVGRLHRATRNVERHFVCLSLCQVNETLRRQSLSNNALTFAWWRGCLLPRRTLCSHVSGQHSQRCIISNR
jgi:hypothetical protein